MNVKIVKLLNLIRFRIIGTILLSIKSFRLISFGTSSLILLQKLNNNLNKYSLLFILGICGVICIFSFIKLPKRNFLLFFNIIGLKLQYEIEHSVNP